MAIPNNTANTVSAIASSRATIGSNISTNLPFALYCLTTIKVAAGAVAVEIAPNVKAWAIVNVSGCNKETTIRQTLTKKVAPKASQKPTITAFLPICFKSFTLNSLPIEKAIKPRATSDTIDNFSTSSNVKKPTPSTFN